MSSSCIRSPSYRNLRDRRFQSLAPAQRKEKEGRRRRDSTLSKRKTTLENPPDARHVFADLARIGALELAELGAALNLEEHFLAGRRYDLERRNPQRLPHRAPQWRPHLDVNRRVWIVVLSLNFVLAGAALQFFVRHFFSLRVQKCKNAADTALEGGGR